LIVAASVTNGRPSLQDRREASQDGSPGAV
jgi:hypothetical protein